MGCQARMKLFLVGVLCLAAYAAAKPSQVPVGFSHKTRQVTSSNNFYENYVRAIQKIDSDPLVRGLLERQFADVQIAESRRLELLAIRRGSPRESCSGTFRSASKPTRVDRLQVGDFDVVAALGDSLTAGNGAAASTIFGCLTNYRQYSWSIGGEGSIEQRMTTLPNILETFNPNVKGYSTDTGDENSRGAGMNVAVAGAISADMPSQANHLVQKLREDPSIDYENDWKLVTLFIGGNNLCAYCDDKTGHSAEAYISEVRQALDILYTVPRVYINLAEIFDIAPIVQLGTGFICGLVHEQVCPCGKGNNVDIPELKEWSRFYQMATQDLISTGRYNTRSDARVILQPFFRDTVPPNTNGNPDMSFFAPDCFHFSKKGHYEAGKALFNTMLQPIGSKSTDWGLGEQVKCPQPGTYLPA